jgi:hypothetical protein
VPDYPAANQIAVHRTMPIEQLRILRDSRDPRSCFSVGTFLILLTDGLLAAQLILRL